MLTLKCWRTTGKGRRKPEVGKPHFATIMVKLESGQIIMEFKSRRNFDKEPTIFIKESTHRLFITYRDLLLLKIIIIAIIIKWRNRMNLECVSKIKITNEGQMDVVCLQMWYSEMDTIFPISAKKMECSIIKSSVWEVQFIFKKH